MSSLPPDSVIIILTIFLMFATAFVLRRRSAIKRLPALATEFKNENDNQLLGKISNNKMLDGQSGIKDDLAHELKDFQIIYDTVGPHPNLVHTYGIAHVSYEKKMKRTVDGFHTRTNRDGGTKCEGGFPQKMGHHHVTGIKKPVEKSTGF